jgi:acyl-CoA hydrolase
VRSRIVPVLTSVSSTKRLERDNNYFFKGAGVVTTRAHVHYVVTEFGIVDLFGKNMWERADLLISVAHPSKRDELANALSKKAPRWNHVKL